MVLVHTSAESAQTTLWLAAGKSTILCADASVRIAYEKSRMWTVSNITASLDTNTYNSIPQSTDQAGRVTSVCNQAVVCVHIVQLLHAKYSWKCM